MRADEAPGQSAGTGTQRPFARLLVWLRRIYSGAKVVFVVAVWVLGMVVFVWSAGWDNVGTLEFELVAFAAFTWLIALVFGPLLRLSSHNGLIRHHKLMLPEIALGAVIATVPAIGLSLRLRVTLPGDTSTAHSALMATTLAGMFIVFGAILLHMWRPVNHPAANLREQYRRQE